MNGVGILATIIIGILAGWIASRVMERQHGLIINLIVGLIGAWIGAALAAAFNIHFAGFLGSLVVYHRGDRAAVPAQSPASFVG